MRSELKEAIELLRKDDAESVEHALQLLQGTVFSFGMKVCGHREDAEDTVQEVLVHALPHLAKLEDPQAMAAWLYTAARNRCWQNRRRLSYRKAVALEDLMPDEAELSALLKDGEPSPEAVAASREDHQLLHRAVLSLPPQYRMVLVLVDMEELETEQVAKILSLQPGTVRVRLHRARLLVRQEMSRLLRGETGQRSQKKKNSRRGAPCRAIFANLSEYLDGRMRPASCKSMQRHIEACPACVAFIQDLKQAIDRCRSLEFRSDREPSPVLRRLLREEYFRLVGNSASLL